MSQNSKRVCIGVLGLSLGLTWGLGLFLTGIGAWLYPPWGNAFIATLSSVYVGFDASLRGAILGLLWGFLDGFIGGVILALLYNFFVRRCPCKFCQSSEKESPKTD
jgi:small basic protein